MDNYCINETIMIVTTKTMYYYEVDIVKFSVITVNEK